MHMSCPHTGSLQSGAHNQSGLNSHVNAGQFTCSSITTALNASSPNLADSAAAAPAQPVQGNVSSLAPGEKLYAPTQPVTGIVRAVGTRFQLPDGTPFYFQVTAERELACPHSRQS